MTSVEQVKVDDCMLEEEQLIKQQEELRSAVVDLTRLAQIKADEREQKARDFMRAEVPWCYFAICFVFEMVPGKRFEDLKLYVIQ